MSKYGEAVYVTRAHKIFGYGTADIQAGFEGEGQSVTQEYSPKDIRFRTSKDKNNERWLELNQYPSRYKDPVKNPSFEEVMSEQHNVFKKHPETKFIAAHLGWFGNDLARLGKLLDEMPNAYTELGAVLAEISLLAVEYNPKPNIFNLHSKYLNPTELSLLPANLPRKRADQ